MNERDKHFLEKVGEENETEDEYLFSICDRRS